MDVNNDATEAGETTDRPARRGRDPRHPAQIAKDRRTAARLTIEGLTQTEIAARLGISQPQVSKDVAFVYREWKRDRVGYMAVAIEKELARIDADERQAWRGWRRSLRDAVKVREEAVRAKDSGAVGVKRTTERTGQSGDPRFLETILRCSERRSKLLGLDAPAKSLGLTLEDMRAMTDAELAAVAEGRPLPARDPGAGGIAPTPTRKGE